MTVQIETPDGKGLIHLLMHNPFILNTQEIDNIMLNKTELWQKQKFGNQKTTGNKRCN